MFDLGMSELLVVGVVALIVIGPKDLPVLFRSMGKFTAKLRAMAREFSRAMESAADESGVKDVARDLRAVTSPKSMGLDAVRDAADRFEKWDPLKEATKPAAAKPSTAQPSALKAAEAAQASSAGIAKTAGVTPAVADAAATEVAVTEAAVTTTPDTGPAPQRHAVLSSAGKRAAAVASETTSEPPKAEL